MPQTIPRAAAMTGFSAWQRATVSHEELRIPKRQKPVTLWVHPEGRVVGSVFLNLQSEAGGGEEQPAEIFNNPTPFLVLWRSDLNEHRFYNKRSVVRVEYDEAPPPGGPCTRIGCRLQMMDGSVVQGRIVEALPPEHSRLFDYINQEGERFLRVYVDGTRSCLVNKAYIVHITQVEE